MSRFSDLVEGIRVELNADTGEEVVANFVNLPQGSQRQDLVCVWADSYAPSADVYSEEHILVHVRWYRQFQQVRDGRVDMLRLYDAAELIENSLLDKQADQFGVWMLLLEGGDFDEDVQFAEVAFRAIHANPFDGGA